MARTIRLCLIYGSKFLIQNLLICLISKAKELANVVLVEFVYTYATSFRNLSKGCTCSWQKYNWIQVCSVKFLLQYFVYIFVYIKQLTHASHQNSFCCSLIKIITGIKIGLGRCQILTLNSQDISRRAAYSIFYTLGVTCKNKIRYLYTYIKLC